MFKNDEERLQYVEDENNWITIYENQKFNLKIQIFTLLHLRFIRYSVKVIGSYHYKNGEEYWMDASTRRIGDTGAQSSYTYTENQIVQEIKNIRDLLKK